MYHYCMLNLKMINPMNVKLALTTKLLSVGLDVSVIPSLILSFRSDTLVRDILPWGKMNLTERILDAQTHIYKKCMNYPWETKQKLHHLGLWFVIAVWRAKASVYILRSKRSIDKTSCVYLTSTAHVQPVWRSMRWDVWYNTHVEMYINHLKNSKMWNDWYGTHTSVSHMPPWCLLRHMQKST